MTDAKQTISGVDALRQFAEAFEFKDLIKQVDSLNEKALALIKGEYSILDQLNEPRKGTENEPKKDQPKPDEPKSDVPKADEPKAGPNDGPSLHPPGWTPQVEEPRADGVPLNEADADPEFLKITKSKKFQDKLKTNNAQPNPNVDMKTPQDKVKNMSFPQDASADEINNQIKKIFIEETILNLAQAIGMSPEAYSSYWPLFFKLYLKLNHDEDQKVPWNEVEDYFDIRSTQKGLEKDLRKKIQNEVLDFGVSLKEGEDWPIMKFFEKFLQFEAKVRIAMN